MMAEKFSIPEVSALRNEFLHSGLDSIQAGELLQIFLMGRGYGVSPEAARAAAGQIGGEGCSVEAIQRELEHLALMM